MFSAILSHGQLSPGDLSNAHAELEGLSKCTLCHDIGNKVTNEKCLDCHTDIQDLIKKNRGYHSSSEVKSKDCFACHGEHFGRKFDMVRFDQKKFKHDLTKYALEGGHAMVECRKCHIPENILDPKIKKREKTYLGLRQECATCHDDYHQRTLSVDCAKCHTVEKFKPATKFNHNMTKFKLTGKHVEVDCKECHKITTRSGKKFQQFANVPHNDCMACHKDPHEKRIHGKCAQCHTENIFSEFVGRERFDHSTTHFFLRGKHKTVGCFECHKKSIDPLTVFMVRPIVHENQCAVCHKDVHERKFGNDCAKCHTENGWKSLKSLESFNHSVTDFPLVGKHIDVDCKKCHKGRYTDPLDFYACKNCHEDYHRSEFASKEGVTPDCAECHSVMQAFTSTSYTIERHQKTQFKLEGAHLATPCFSCHVKEEKRWVFRYIGSTCMQCHKNIHGEKYAIKGVTECKRCHVSENWFPSKFDHRLTKFPLDGRHIKVDCKECHKPDNVTRKTQFKIAKFQCLDCHL